MSLIVQLKNYSAFCELDCTSDDYICRAVSKGKNPTLRWKILLISFLAHQRELFWVLKAVEFKWRKYGIQSLCSGGATAALNKKLSGRLLNSTAVVGCTEQSKRRIHYWWCKYSLISFKLFFFFFFQDVTMIPLLLITREKSSTDRIFEFFNPLNAKFTKKIIVNMVHRYCNFSAVTLDYWWKFRENVWYCGDVAK